MLDAFKATAGKKLSPLTLLYMVDFREKYQNGEWHDHLGVKADRAFRFLPTTTKATIRKPTQTQKKPITLNISK